MKKSVSKIVKAFSWGNDTNVIVDIHGNDILCSEWVTEHFGIYDENKKYKLTITRNDIDGLITFYREIDSLHGYQYEYTYSWKYSKGKYRWKDNSIYYHLEKMIELMFKENENFIRVDFYLEEI